MYTSLYTMVQYFLIMDYSLVFLNSQLLNINVTQGFFFHLILIFLTKNLIQTNLNSFSFLPLLFYSMFWFFENKYRDLNCWRRSYIICLFF